MSQLTDAEIRVLRAARFTLREINTQQRKFHNLLRVSPWLVEDLERREWVGLTDEEILKIWKSDDEPKGVVEFVREIEAKLKEKNA